jgi:hypothetical protein
MKPARHRMGVREGLINNLSVESNCADEYRILRFGERK